MQRVRKEMTEEEITAFEPTEKIGLLASISNEGLPHISLITSIQAIGPNKLVLGEFSKGLSKDFIQKNNNIGFIILTLDRRLWNGTAQWTHLRREGPEYEMMNMKPMFRYNTYFGINTVHYLDLVQISGGSSLPMGAITKSALLTKFMRGGAATGNKEPILKPLAKAIFNKLDSLSFLSYIGDDGFPVLVPVIQCQAADSRRLAFSTAAFKDEIAAIPEGATVAVFAVTMQMEDILIRGTYQGIARKRGVLLGTVDIDWVYNSMPPAHGQIYPKIELEAVTEF